MQVVFQPKNSRLCGQCSIACLTGERLEFIIGLFRHSHGTTTKQLIEVLWLLSIECGSRLERNTGTFPETCIVKVNWKKGSHWVLFYKGYIYCSELGKLDFKDYLIYLGIHQGVIKSYLWIKQS